MVWAIGLFGATAGVRNRTFLSEVSRLLCFFSSFFSTTSFQLFTGPLGDISIRTVLISTYLRVPPRHFLFPSLFSYPS